MLGYLTVRRADYTIRKQNGQSFEIELHVQWVKANMSIVFLISH